MNKVLKALIMSLLVSGSFLTCTSVKAASVDNIQDNKAAVNTVSQKNKVPNIPNTTKPKYPSFLVIIGDDVCFRRGPGTNYEIIDILQKGTHVTQNGYENGWFKVIYNGIKGYVHGNYIA